MSELKVFNFHDNNVRTIDFNGAVWFVLKDVCNVLGLSNARMVHDRLSEDVSSTYPLQTAGGRQNFIIINEDGLYDVVLESRKPEAREFRKWVTRDVIPSIRKTGSYSVTGYTPSQQLQAIFMLDGRQQEIESRMERLENNTTIDYGQQLALKKAGNAAMMTLIGGKESPAYHNRSLRSKAYAAFWSNYKDYLNVNSINNTLVKDYDRGLEYVHRLTLPGELVREIEASNMQITL